MRPASSAAARILVERTIERVQAATGAAAAAAQDEPEGTEAAAAESHTLPSVSVDERKVSIGWDGTVWSK